MISHHRSKKDRRKKYKIQGMPYAYEDPFDYRSHRAIIQRREMRQSYRLHGPLSSIRCFKPDWPQSTQSGSLTVAVRSDLIRHPFASTPAMKG
jgi:hypothetical protein